MFQFHYSKAVRAQVKSPQQRQPALLCVELRTLRPSRRPSTLSNQASRHLEVRTANSNHEDAAQRASETDDGSREYGGGAVERGGRRRRAVPQARGCVAQRLQDAARVNGSEHEVAEL